MLRFLFLYVGIFIWLKRKNAYNGIIYIKQPPKTMLLSSGVVLFDVLVYSFATSASVIRWKPAFSSAASAAVLSATRSTT